MQAGQHASSLSSGVPFSPAPGSPCQGRKACGDASHGRDATAQENAVWEEGRRKEGEAFQPFVKSSGPSRWEGKEVTPALTL